MLWLRPDLFLISPPPAPAPGLEPPAPARRGAAAGAAEKEKEPRDPADAAVAPQASPIRGEGRGVSTYDGVRDAACPLSTG
jgi:hypothetical protein